MSEASNETPPAPRPSAPKGKGVPPAVRIVGTLAFVVVAGYLLWLLVGSALYDQYREYRRAAEERDAAAPVGYIGLNYRRTYNNRAPQFIFEDEGGRRLWASIGEMEQGGDPEFYDISEAQFDPEVLQGGFGKDSIPGVDYPILQEPGGEIAGNLRDAHEVVGIEADGVAHAYPVGLLSKTEVVNDTVGDLPVLAYYARGDDRVRLYRREVDGAPITFGTTGYATDEKKPLLYDRKTNGLWLPSASGDALVCVNGELAGTELPAVDGAVRTDWGRWRRDHRDTLVVIGNDRDKPIPEE